jgi:hypothetical protein
VSPPRGPAATARDHQRCRRLRPPTTSMRASSAAPSMPCMTAAMTPSPASCSESSSAPTPRSSPTTARPSPPCTAARKAERCSFESISLCVVLRCPAQAVAHHPRRQRRRLASASPVSCAGAPFARAERHGLRDADCRLRRAVQTPPADPTLMTRRWADGALGTVDYVGLPKKNRQMCVDTQDRSNQARAAAGGPRRAGA